jgi:hypothetical protein
MNRYYVSTLVVHAVEVIYLNTCQTIYCAHNPNQTEKIIKSFKNVSE